jgi:hypothetical protein
VTDLQVLSREQIASQVAESSAPQDAALLWRYARAGTAAADRQPVQSYRLPPTCRSRFVFEEPATCPADWEPALVDAVQQAGAQLNGMACGAVTLSLVVKRGGRTGSKLLRENTSSTRTLLRFAQDLANAIIERGDEVQAVEVTLSRLVASGVQTTLFDGARFSNLPRRECPPILIRALRNLETRYAGTLWRWLLRDQHNPLPEERFSRVPLKECAEDAELQGTGSLGARVPRH